MVLMMVCCNKLTNIWTFSTISGLKPLNVSDFLKGPAEYILHPRSPPQGGNIFSPEHCGFLTWYAGQWTVFKIELHLLILPNGSFLLGFITFIVLFQFSS